MPRRLHGIQFTAINDPCFKLENMAWTIEGQRTDQSGWEYLRIERTEFYHTREHRMILVYFDGSIYFKNLRLFINHFHFQVCNVELLVFHDECGHPEVPLNGWVQWNPGDTEAIYRCDDGYRLNVPSATRQCVQGEWNGLQAICECNFKDHFKMIWYDKSNLINFNVIGVNQKSSRTTPRLLVKIDVYIFIQLLIFSCMQYYNR